MLLRESVESEDRVYRLFSLKSILYGFRPSVLPETWPLERMVDFSPSFKAILIFPWSLHALTSGGFTLYQSLKFTFILH